MCRVLRIFFYGAPRQCSSWVRTIATRLFSFCTYATRTETSTGETRGTCLEQTFGPTITSSSLSSVHLTDGGPDVALEPNAVPRRPTPLLSDIIPTRRVPTRPTPTRTITALRPNVKPMSLNNGY
ncbi:hypothetical protein V2G26_019615 [Clonostachys chloroleuca]